MINGIKENEIREYLMEQQEIISRIGVNKKRQTVNEWLSYD